MCHPDATTGGGGDRRSAGWIDLPVGDGRLPALLVEARTERGRVLLVHDIFGPSSFYEMLVTVLADAGYTTLLPDLFWRSPPLARDGSTLSDARERLRATDGRVLFRDQEAAVDWLRGRGHPAARIGTVGFCWGGTQVLMLASAREDVATVCYYGLPADPGFASDPGSPRPIDVVGRMKGPVVAFWGDQDESVGMENVVSFLQRAKAEDAGVEAHIFPDVGHGFMARSHREGGWDPGSPAQLSWTRTLEFLDEHVGRPVTDG